MDIYSSGNIFYLEKNGKVIVSGERNSFQVFEHISNEKLVVLQSRFGGRRYTIHWVDLGCSSRADCINHVSNVIFKIDGTDSDTNNDTDGLLLHPSIYRIEHRFLSPNSNEDIILHGGCFDPETSVEVKNQMVNSVTYVNDKTLIVNVTVDDKVGTFDVISRNGALEGSVMGGIEVGPLSLETVNWKLNSTNTTISEDKMSLTKDVANGWNAGAISTKGINYSNGYMEITPIYPSGNARYMIGLSYLENGFSYSDIQFSFYFASKNFYIYENGRNIRNMGAWNDGDVFKIDLVDDEIIYRRNGIFVYKSTLPDVEYPLFVDCSLYDAITVGDVKLFGNLIEL